VHRQLPFRGIRRLLAAALGTLAPLLATPAVAQPAPSASPWKVNIVPYLWAAGVSGSVSDRAGRSASFNENFGDVVSHLNAALMLLGSARYGRWVMLADFDYVNVSAKSRAESRIVGQVSVSATTYVGTVAGGYRVIDRPAGTLDLMAGARVISVNSTTDFSGGLLPAVSIGSGDTWADPIFAVRAIMPIGAGFSANVYGDVGGGPGNDLTWQVYGGIGYAIGPRVEAYLGYRYLSIRHTSNGLDSTLNQQGPMLGVGYRF
jgi:opacity protein-like surface antigen